MFNLQNIYDMSYTKNNYPDAMKFLSETERNKAIDIANELINKRKIDRKRAIPISISKAKEWAENR